ncbi:MAG: cysteine desulfurase [Bacteroidota bacterium]|nr:cysteine desulfurase [Bacteroidota bacterium]
MDPHVLSTTSELDATRLAEVRADFPALAVEVSGQPLAYLDNAATAQKPQAVIDRLDQYYREENANVHRGVHALSQRATDAYEGARQQIADFIGASSAREIVITRGTTEAINLIAQSFGGSWGPGDEVIVSEMEHHSNIVPWQLLAERTGIKLRVVPVTEDGELDLGEFHMLLSSRTKLVALVHVSNTLGTVNPVRRIIADAHGMGVPVMLDGAQSVPHAPVNVSDLDVDFYCFSSHKLFGPTGVGVLYGKAELLEAMTPWQGGGDMIEQVDFAGTTFNEIPHKFEAGTPHIAGVIGMAAAADYVDSLGWDWIKRQEQDLLDYSTGRLQAIDGLRVVGTAPKKAAVISFLLGEAHPYDVGTVLDRLGVAVRTGHHCTQPLMKRYGIPGTVRASFAFYNTREEVDRLVSSLERAAGMLG